VTAPQPISGLLELQKREGACMDCGASIPQEGVRIGEGVKWSPLRCAACGAKHLETRRADHKQAEGLIAEQRKKQEARQAIESLQVPPLYRAVTLDNFELHGDPANREAQARVLQLGRRYVGLWPDVPDVLLVLRGGPGTGKGHWAWSITKQLTQLHALRARVVKLADLVRRLRASWGREDEESEIAAITFFRALDLLVIDEVSRHAFYGQNIHQHLYDVLDHRAEYQRATILTTNESNAGLEDVLRPALVDRLCYHGGILEFGSLSYRARRGGER